MTTTDTDALTERLWEAIAEARDKGERTAHDVDSYEVVAAVLPIVAVEVRKAKAEALDEFAAWAESLNDKHPRFKAANDLAADMAKRFKADNYETGDSDERR